jgi:flavin reductase (DIM6/NTAB) family NADH-FMN oxidoreductase RutF
MHIKSEPPILYFGTPVALISTVNEDQSYNLAPMSSIFWLGWRCMLGLGTASQTVQNINRTGECVLNLPSVAMVGAVNRLALTTGRNPIPAGKLQKGYRYEKEKFETAGLTPAPSETVLAPRVAECLVQMEAKLVATHRVGEDEPLQAGRIVSFEMRIQRVYLHPSILMEGHNNRVDPDKWRPLIMSFQQFYGLGQQVHPSTLSQIPEALYRSADIERARELLV